MSLQRFTVDAQINSLRNNLSRDQTARYGLTDKITDSHDLKINNIRAVAAIAVILFSRRLFLGRLFRRLERFSWEYSLRVSYKSGLAENNLSAYRIKVTVWRTTLENNISVS